MLERSAIFSQERIERVWEIPQAKRKVWNLVVLYWQSLLPALLVILVCAAALGLISVGGALSSRSAFGTDGLPKLSAVVATRYLLSAAAPEEKGSEVPRFDTKDAAVLKDQVDIKILSARVFWTQTAFLTLLGAIGVLFASQYLIFRCGMKCALSTDLVACIVAVVLGTAVPQDLAPVGYRELLHAAANDSPLLSCVTKALNVGAVMAVVFVTCAACATLVSSANTSKLQAQSLARSMRRILVLLYLSAAFLSVGAREIASLYSWPAAWFPDPIAKDIQALATSVSTAMGTFFSAVLLAVFIPCNAVLLSRARAIGRRELGPMASPQDVDLWMAKNELEFGAQQFSVTAATLAPFLVGGPLAAIGTRFIG